MANFLKECAADLDKGVFASEVLERMRERYHTLPCLKVKVCLVRQLCRVCPEYEVSWKLLHEALSEERPELLMREDTDPEVREYMRRLPPKLSHNARQLRLTHKEQTMCKRTAERRVLQRNRTRVCVDGRRLLRVARENVRDLKRIRLPSLALSLMLLTGRRTCEILNGRSCFEHEGVHTLRFVGQAKKRGCVESYTIPVLDDTEVLLEAMRVLREMQSHVQLDNKTTSRRYQSRLSRETLDSTYQGCVHGLRGIYTCMALELFRWERTFTPNFVAACILGHCGLEESLTYTTFYLGDDWEEEPKMGEGLLTCPPLPCR